MVAASHSTAPLQVVNEGSRTWRGTRRVPRADDVAAELALGRLIGTLRLPPGPGTLGH